MSDLRNTIEEWYALQELARRARVEPWLHEVDKSSEREFLFVLMGDEHMGAATYKEDVHLEHLDWCIDHNVEIVHMGDGLECATRDSVGDGVYKQREIIEYQMDHFYEIYRHASAKKLLWGLHPGNHEARVFKATGLDVTRILAERLGVKYFDIGQIHKVVVGDIDYIVYTTHGASGARLPHTKIKACMDLAKFIDADIYCFAHLHQMAHHPGPRYRVNKYGEIEMRKRHFILTGSYLGHWGSYAHLKNYEPMDLGSPKINLDGKKFRAQVVLS